MSVCPVSPGLTPFAFADYRSAGAASRLSPRRRPPHRPSSFAGAGHGTRGRRRLDPSTWRRGAAMARL